MECEFCHTNLPGSAPENVLLLNHVRANKTCDRDYRFLLENIRSSWTVNMSGG